MVNNFAAVLNSRFLFIVGYAEIAGTMVRYALVEWDEDRSLSVVRLSRFLTREGPKVTQKWGARIYPGTILQESGKYV